VELDRGREVIWRDYATDRPPAAGEYFWRVPSNALPGLFVLVRAKHRLRGAGHENVLSPEFDHWTGYRVTVPAGVQWREAVESDPKVAPEGIDVEPCPYCGKTPKWEALEGGELGGVVICGDPHRFNRWWLNCCPWGQVPHLRDPREIARIRAAAFARMREGVTA
jgi:hypothetical protein